jgi:Putative translation initiation inhibitor, yjgF family
MDRVWREYFPKQPPARAVLGVHRMPTDTPVEINAVAFAISPAESPSFLPDYPPTSPATAGVMAGDRLYLSGSFGADIGSGRVPADPAAQVQLALDNMKQTLMAAGMDFRHVVFVNPYLTDNASGQMNAIYAKQFEFGNTPARATIRVASLPGGNTIEFTGVAVADLSKRLAVRPKNMRPSATAAPVSLPATRSSVRRRALSRRDPTRCRASMPRPSRRRYGSRCGTSSMAWKRRA